MMLITNDTTLVLCLLIAIVSIISSSVDGKKKDRNVPHGHYGKLKQYTPGPFTSLKLTKDEISTLEKGQSIMKQIMPDSKSDGGGSAICVQDITAPIQAVWYQILDLDNYTKKVPKLIEHKNYVVKKNNDGTMTIKTKQVLGVLPGYSYESYFDHTYYPKHSSMTWTLDYDKTSDFDDISGHWHVQEIDSNYCRVFYAADIKMKGSVPGPILNYISKQALKQATAWVKKESENNLSATIPSHLGSGTDLPKFRGGSSTSTSTSTATTSDSSAANGLFGMTKLPKWGRFNNLLPKRKL